MSSSQSGAGSTLTYVTATDTDLEYANSRLEYSLLTGAGGTDTDYFLFDIALSSGAILLVDPPLLLALGGVYRLVVLVSDRGDPPLNATTTVCITVTTSLTTSGGFLEFSEMNYGVVVPENIPLLSQVASVTASNGGPVNSLVSSLLHNNISLERSNIYCGTSQVVSMSVFLSA